MARKMYWADHLTGGDEGALDAIDGAGLASAAGALVLNMTDAYFYSLDDDLAGSEASPTVISPDTNAGDKRWVLQRLVGSGATIREVVKTATGDLTAVECSSTIINNYDQDDDATLTMPTAAAGLSFMAVCGTTVAKYLRIKADTNDKIYLNGVAGSDNGYVGIASAAVGAAITFASFQTGASAWDWIATTLANTWVAG